MQRLAISYRARNGVEVKRIRLLRGLRTAKTRPPTSTFVEDVPAGSVALTGADTPGIRPNFEVEPGARVQVGDCLFVDRADRAVRYVSPISGQVLSADYGPRRTLSSVIVKADANAETEQRANPKPVDIADGKAVRQALLHVGLWPAFRARPFGRVPRSDAVPNAVVVSALHNGLCAPDPAVLIGEKRTEFQAGLQAIASLSSADTAFPIIVCQAGSVPLYDGDEPHIKTVQFVGSHLAALPSTHVYQLAPARIDAPVWTIGYQDILAIGTLALHGRYDPTYVVAVGGAGANTPRLVRTAIGANLRALIGEAARDGARSLTLSGPGLSGRKAAFLGRYDTQASVQTSRENTRQGNWLSRLTIRHARNPLPLIANSALGAVLPANVLAVPLMRALAVGDIEAAMRLGALDLVEEDVAPLTQLCPSGADYPSLLRNALDSIAQDYA